MSTSPVRIPLKRHDTLSRHGYGGVSMSGVDQGVKRLSVSARREALVRAVRDYGPTYVIRKLNVLAIYTKNKDPTLSRTYRADMRFVQGLVRRAVRRAGGGAKASRARSGPSAGRR